MTNEGQKRNRRRKKWASHSFNPAKANDICLLERDLGLSLLFPLRHDSIDNLRQPLSFLLDHHPGKIGAAANIDGHLHPTSQNPGRACCIIYTSWGRIES